MTVETTDATAFRETVEGTLADIAVGDNIVAIGTASDAGISAANIVDVGDDAAGTDFPAPAVRHSTCDGDRRGPGAGGVTAGTVESIDGTTITVESVDGSTVIGRDDGRHDDHRHQGDLARGPRGGRHRERARDGGRFDGDRGHRAEG